MTYRQLPINFARDNASLREYLCRVTGKDIHLTLTDNASSMVSVRQKRGTVFVRLQRIFLGAGQEVLHDIADFIIHGRGRHPNIAQFVRNCRDLLPEAERRPPRLQPEGRFHNLRQVRDDLNQRYFNERLRVGISWGRRVRRCAVKKRTLGSYQSDTNTIRINRLLDSKRVPRYFIGFVVYHEMLHADMGTECRNGRRIIHSRQFCKREKIYHDYDRAVCWERKFFTMPGPRDAGDALEQGLKKAPR